ncbi:hypothetical protein HUT19_31070 [Streptomyces sp. NA02950]|uniref:hypothetical protein n=1 Tax=Streptomyces sp. NA02950 TaxID=2742137 RepID=UPI0015924814|nr:hypothetical protein [Streptomyces sp. NA02950]QKV95638.1 hypothetical protein HUT19_31070 [Streptomyces sp. NA02950]
MTDSRPVLRAVAIVSVLPYIALKSAWMAGSHLGIPEGSTLLEPGRRTSMLVINGVTLLMDAAVVVLALLLTRPWGRRVPAWLPALPAWTACGLLAPIMTGFPAQLVTRALGFGGSGDDHAEERGRFLADWVYGVVYGGFIVQGLALGALFVLYARERWGHLWRGRIADLPAWTPARAAHRLTAVIIGVLAALPAATHLLWAGGSAAGLSEDRAAGRTGDFYVLEALYALFAAATVVGVVMLAFRTGRRARPALPLALAWVGSGALACWGAWLTLAGLTADEEAEAPTALMDVTYAVQMIVGLLVLTAGAYFFSGKGHDTRGRRRQRVRAGRAAECRTP